jgi:Cu(I)/Ag(I) efflux system protein CusF
MKMKLASLSLVLMLAVPFPSAHAQPGMKHGNEASAGKEHKASGKITKVDKARGSVTISHGPVASINWPAMSMSFKVKDKAMLDKVKNGDQVEFSFVQSGKDYTITQMQ